MGVSDIIVPSDLITKMGMTTDDFLIEVATHMYDIGKMTMGQARKFAQLDQVAFQQELAKREILIKYDLEDYQDDLDAIAHYLESEDEA